MTPDERRALEKLAQEFYGLATKHHRNLDHAEAYGIAADSLVETLDHLTDEQSEDGRHPNEALRDTLVAVLRVDKEDAAAIVRGIDAVCIETHTWATALHRSPEPPDSNEPEGGPREGPTDASRTIELLDRWGSEDELVERVARSLADMICRMDDFETLDFTDLTDAARKLLHDTSILTTEREG